MNYEALGRHTESVEAIRRLVVEREDAAARLSKFLGGVRRAPEVVCAFSVAQAQQLLDSVADIENALLREVKEANKFAADCDRPLIQVVD